MLIKIQQTFIFNLNQHTSQSTTNVIAVLFLLSISSSMELRYEYRKSIMWPTMFPMCWQYQTRFEDKGMLYRRATFTLWSHKIKFRMINNTPNHLYGCHTFSLY
jgi:hypothetical protein